MQRVQTAFTSDDIYAHLRRFEKTLKQTNEPTHASKAIIFLTHKYMSTSNSQFTINDFVQRLDHEASKDALLLSKMFQDMLSFERKYNKEREKENHKVICFACHREIHTI
jgi:hypothetical protein